LHLKRNHFLFGKVSSILSFNKSGTDCEQGDCTGKLTASRHFTSGNGNSLLHSSVNKSILQSRHTGAPLCSKIDSLEADGFPIRLLYVEMLHIYLICVQFEAFRIIILIIVNPSCKFIFQYFISKYFYLFS
jgi:hypothetical protein